MRSFPLTEVDLGVGMKRETGRVFIGAKVCRWFRRQTVPLLAGDLTGPTGNAALRVNQKCLFARRPLSLVLPLFPLLHDQQVSFSLLSTITARIYGKGEQPLPITEN